jgi:membrane fusion protein, multidrug efflux system
VRRTLSVFTRCLAAFLALSMATLLGACKEKHEAAEPAPRPVRTVTLQKSQAGVPVVLTGRIEALDEAALGFRLSGRMIERKVSVGDRVEAEQVACAARGAQ